MKFRDWVAAAAIALTLACSHLLDEDDSEMLVEQRAVELGRYIDRGQQ